MTVKAEKVEQKINVLTALIFIIYSILTILINRCIIVNE